jgi:hypothetical protein
LRATIDEMKNVSIIHKMRVYGKFGQVFNFSQTFESLISYAFIPIDKQ